MTRVAFFDCFSGISGDMALAALLDAGADLDAVREGLAGLPIGPFELSVRPVTDPGLRATRVEVTPGPGQRERAYREIEEMLGAATLPERARDTARRAFRLLAEAEARVHGQDVEEVAFHEVGAVDTIVDVVGVALALDQLGVAQAFASPIPAGRGTARSRHGSLPLPAPAVAELLRGAPLVPSDAQVELVTPTGAAILAAVVDGFGDLPAMRLESVGYGAGGHRLDPPDVLRVFVGQAEEPAPPLGDVVVETNVDDLSPELHGYVLERLLDVGVQDAWLQPIVMKKGRPGVLVSVLCRADQEARVREVLFRETGTLGLRVRPVVKHALEREVLKVEGRYGPVAVKVGLLGGQVVSVAPEYEDCARLAREASVPAKDVFEEALRLAREALARKDASGRRADP